MPKTNTNLSFTIIFLLFSNLASSSSHPSRSTEQTKVFKKKKYSLHKLIYDDRISSAEYDFDSNNFDLDILCKKKNNKFKISVSFSYNLPKKVFLVLQSKGKVSDTLKSNDYCFTGEGEITLYESWLQTYSKKDVCNELEKYDTSNLIEIQKFFDESDLEVVEDIKSEITGQGMFINLFRYPFEKYGPVYIQSIQSRDASLLTNIFNLRVKEFESKEYEVTPFQNPSQKKVQQMVSKFQSKIKDFCQEREDDESNFSVSTS